MAEESRPKKRKRPKPKKHWRKPNHSCVYIPKDLDTALRYVLPEWFWRKRFGYTFGYSCRAVTCMRIIVHLLARGRLEIDVQEDGDLYLDGEFLGNVRLSEMWESQREVSQRALAWAKQNDKRPQR